MTTEEKQKHIELFLNFMIKTIDMVYHDDICMAELRRIANDTICTTEIGRRVYSNVFGEC